MGRGSLAGHRLVWPKMLPAHGRRATLSTHLTPVSSYRCLYDGLVIAAFRLARGAAVLGISCGAVLPVDAQTRSQDGEAPIVEVWGGLSGTVTAPSGTLASSYSPPLVANGDFTSSSSLTLSFDASRAAGLQLGVNIFPAAHAGFQILFDRTSASVAGGSSPYVVDLQYISRPPPNNEPIPVTIHTSMALPETSGTLEQDIWGFDGIARAGAPGRVGATFSGGLSLHRLSGTIQPLGYTEFRLGGHSVLFSDEYHLAASLEPTWAFGFNIGGDVDVPLGGRAAFMAGARFFGARAASVPVRLTSVVNLDQVIIQHTVDEIARRLAPKPASITPSSLRFLVGVKVGLAGR
jgi:hypothetical protein